MKNICFYKYILISILLFVIVSNAIVVEDLSNDDNDLLNKKSNTEDYYLIYVKNNYGEYKIFNNDNKNKKRDESQIFVDSVLEKINTLIIDNKYTYIYPEKLNKIDGTLKLNKRNSENNSGKTEFVYPISSVKDSVVLYAYLSNDLIIKINTLPFVKSCEPDKNSFDFSHHYYNTFDILEETRWKNLTVRENAPKHLSLISQGMVNKGYINKGAYDNNYYYPSSAGRDIDIVILDSYFDFTYSEFTNDPQRIVRCAAKDTSIDSEYIETSDKICGNENNNHGVEVSDLAAGYEYGAANLANVYGVAIHYQFGVSDSTLLNGLQYIYEKLIRPHKTVINISISGRHDRDSYFYEHSKFLVDGITEKGGIIVSAAGNSGMNLNYSYEVVIPCAFDNVICVGGYSFDATENEYYLNNDSNYGGGVDLYAPYDVQIKTDRDDDPITDSGTSCSSPIVAGMIASLMSDNPDVPHTKDSILNQLLYGSLRETFESYKYYEDLVFANNGKHIVYSEDNIYYGCGVYAGNRPCTYPTKTINSVGFPVTTRASISTAIINSYFTATTTTTTSTTIPTSTTSHFIAYHFKGKNGQGYLLGVPSLDEYEKISLIGQNKYDTWIMENNYDNKPSYLYLSNGNYSEFSKYCLDLSDTIFFDDDYNFLKIVKCDSAKYKFLKRNSSDLIEVFDENNIPYFIKNDRMCVYYSERKSRVSNCNSSNDKIHWDINEVYDFTKDTSNYPLTYTTVKFRGVNSSYNDGKFLGVSELATNDYFNITYSYQYYTWLVSSTTEPSYLYLTNGVNGDVGELTGYCLNLSPHVNNSQEKMNYLRISKCTDTKFKFKYRPNYDNEEYGSIVVFENDRPYSIDTSLYCIHYSGTPRIARCDTYDTTWKMIIED